LRSIAQFLKEGCREYDHVARIGDDTFAMILPGMKRETIGFKIETLYSTVSKTFPQWIENGTVRFALGTALYPDDADTSKLLLAVAEGRNEKRASGPAESLLALHAHNRAEVEPARHEETAFDLEESGAAVPERRAGW
jgi:GGDEF domain-containing protein